MDEWRDSWMNGWMVGLLNGWMVGLLNGWLVGQSIWSRLIKWSQKLAISYRYIYLHMLQGYTLKTKIKSITHKPALISKC